MTTRSNSLPLSARVQKLAAAIAAAFIPLAVYFLAHYKGEGHNYWLYAICLGGLAYSAPSVAQWAEKWAGSLYKAIGFTVLLEGVLVFSPIQWLSISALVILAGINCVIATEAIGRSRSFQPVKIKSKGKGK